jgi:hypothetical protein
VGRMIRRVVSAIALVSCVTFPQVSMSALENPTLAIMGLGPVALPLTANGASLFVFPGDIISGTLSRMPYQSGVVQLMARNTDGTWNATLAATDITRRAGSAVVSWTIPASDLGCDGRKPSVEIIAVLARLRVPPGRLDPAVNSGALARSTPVVMSCVDFDASRIEILDVGYAPTNAANPPRVSHYEDVRVALDGVPPGAIVQLCLRPIENPNIWCQDAAHPTTGIEWLGTAYIGRPDLRRGPAGWEFIDQFARFWITAAIVRRPLPVRPANGIGPDEWISLRPLVIKESAPVEVIRGFRPGQVRLIITGLGTTNGRVRLVDPISRVTGHFRPLPGYVRNPKQVLTLLVRRLNDKEWEVAGRATIPGDQTTWLVSAADLDPFPSPSHDERIAIVVLSDRRFPPDTPVSEAMLHDYALSISDEVRFALFDRPR